MYLYLLAELKLSIVISFGSYLFCDPSDQIVGQSVSFTNDH